MRCPEDESEISAYEPAPGITSAVYASYQLTGQGTTINQGILVATGLTKVMFLVLIQVVLFYSSSAMKLLRYFSGRRSGLLML